MGQMKALAKVALGPGAMRVVQRPIPECDSGEVLIRVSTASICGSDLHMYLGEIECQTGIVMGHEFVGRIAALAADVDGWQPGDRVTGELHVGACGRCGYCTNDMVMMCPSKTPPGWATDGAFAEYMKLPASLLHRVPDSVPDQMAALTEPIAGILGVVNVLGVRPTDFVVVLGDGPVGLTAAKVARALGAAQVALVGRGTPCGLRLAAARGMGLDMVLDHDLDDVAATVKAATGGLGADLVIEAAGHEDAVRTAIHAIRPAGRFCAIGLTATPAISVEWNELMRKRVQVAFTWSADAASFDHALALLADGSLSFPEEMIRTYTLDQWHDAFDALASQQVVKAQFVMD